MHYRQKHIIVFLCILFRLVTGARAAEGMSFTEVEQTSYRLYTEKSWDQLDAFCDKVLKEGTDYYYLRIRAGVACFEKHVYRKALMHFTKALTFNTADEFALEYLYYCYLYTDDTEHAQRLYGTFDAGFRTRAGIHKKAVDYVGLEAGVKTTHEALYNDALYGQLSVAHTLSHKVSLVHAFTYYSQTEFRYSVKQYQYYLQARMALRKNYTVAAAAHYIGSAIVTNDTNFIFPVPPPRPPLPKKEAVHYSYTAPSYVGAIALLKKTALFDYSAGATYVHNDSANQYMGQLGVIWYPFKTNRLGIGANVYVHTRDNSGNVYMGYAPAISLNPAGRLSVSAAWLKNNGANITEYNGSLVNNSIDLTTSRLSVTTSYGITKKIYLYGTYGYEQKEVLADPMKGLTYAYHIFLAGIKYIP